MSSKRLLVGAAGVLVVLHVAKAVLFLSAGQPPLFRDGLGYWQLGAQMAEGDWLLRADPQAFRVPGYPAFLGICQAVFGDWALPAAVVLQQAAVVVVALLTAWLCRRTTGSNLAAVIALGLSLLCISRSYLGLYLLSDNLLCLLLTAFWVCLVLWFERPWWGLAALMGLLLAACTLVRPVAQLAAGPALLAMALHLHQQHQLRRLAGQGACLLGVLLAVIAPWVIRNQLCFGQPFLSKSLGRQLWDSAFLGEPEDNCFSPSLRLAADGPTTQRVLAELGQRQVNLREYAAVDQALRARGYSEIESDDLMREVALEAIRAEPAKVLSSRAYRCLLFWITAEEVLRWHYRDLKPGEVASGFALGPTEEPAGYHGQRTWVCPPLADLLDIVVDCVWYPSRWLYALALAATIWGWVDWVRTPQRRGLGLAFGLFLLYFCVATALPARPMYRYRMILEPLMIVVVAPALARLLQRKPGKGSVLRF